MFVALLGALLCAAHFSAAQDHPSEYDVKSVYLLNFGKFVHYSSANPPDATFDICVLGKSPIDQPLERITQGERIDDRPVRVLRRDRAADARTCAVVFVGDSEADHLQRDLAALEGADVLTVSDAAQFVDRGGMIQFVMDNKRVRFAINLDAVSRTRLQLSSELLKVAQSVKGRAPGMEANP